MLLSSRPKHFSFADRVAPGVEVKLDWADAEELSGQSTLTGICREHQMDPDAVVSVHLPPGTTDRHGMSATADNVGTVIEFTHTAFGNAVDPDWLTLHSDRRFDYRTQVDTLATITDVTGYPIALENAPDSGQLYRPEDIAVFGFLANNVDQLADTRLLIDTNHVPEDRTELAIDSDAVAAILEQMDGALRDCMEKGFRNFLRNQVAEPAVDLDPGDPWRPALITLELVGGERVQAVHLNDPKGDGTPDVQNGAPAGMKAVIEFCREHDVVIVLEPGNKDNEQVKAALDWLLDVL